MLQVQLQVLYYLVEFKIIIKAVLFKMIKLKLKIKETYFHMSVFHKLEL